MRIYHDLAAQGYGTSLANLDAQQQLSDARHQLDVLAKREAEDTSMTQEGQSAARVSGACFAMGEAAGLAAAIALSGNTLPREIAVERLQQALKEGGAFVGRDQAVPVGL